MTPDQVPDTTAETAASAITEHLAPGAWTLPYAKTLSRTALAAVIPQHNADLLYHLAREVDTAASGGMEPVLNHRLAHMLRTRAAREAQR